ncbi:hypothetical protein EMCG_05865 [[Emmonsia] crescens]|uniref:Uncharacterized protein n=1 Tax=[Emmonsia] crescens TaxID=73230 RepID=A0A0G2JC28_9EURO|nr:hypothetical protein EMCG_05865 [Emmonsia crescens UAMH 3008]
MAGNSKVGNRGLYEAGDQRHSPQSVAIEARRNRDHPPVSNRRGSHHAKEQLLAKNGSMPTDEELAKHDPTAPVSLFRLRVSVSLSRAKMHGHKPSRGAVIDAELRAEDEERLRQKGYK